VSLQSLSLSPCDDHRVQTYYTLLTHTPLFCRLCTYLLSYPLPTSLSISVFICPNSLSISLTARRWSLHVCVHTPNHHYSHPRRPQKLVQPMSPNLHTKARASLHQAHQPTASSTQRESTLSQVSGVKRKRAPAPQRKKALTAPVSPLLGARRRVVTRTSSRLAQKQRQPQQQQQQQQRRRVHKQSNDQQKRQKKKKKQKKHSQPRALTTPMSPCFATKQRASVRGVLQARDPNTSRMNSSSSSSSSLSTSSRPRQAKKKKSNSKSKPMRQLTQPVSPFLSTKLRANTREQEYYHVGTSSLLGASARVSAGVDGDPSSSKSAAYSTRLRPRGSRVDQLRSSLYRNLRV
jgi:hypothetical protein